MTITSRDLSMVSRNITTTLTFRNGHEWFTLITVSTLSVNHLGLLSYDNLVSHIGHVGHVFHDLFAGHVSCVGHISHVSDVICVSHVISSCHSCHIGGWGG